MHRKEACSPNSSNAELPLTVETHDRAVEDDRPLQLGGEEGFPRVCGTI
jgi:hypothetical protein